MAITDVEEFAHITDADIESLGVELDAIRQDFEDARGERDSRYIHRTIAAQRALEAAGRVMLAASSRRSAWWAGTATLGVAKIVENMEIGHNVMHGQWDWMNDPEIHSSTWEWDMSGPPSTGATPTTSCTTSTPTSSAWTTMWATACCGSPAISAGSRSTLATCCLTPFSRSASSGESGCSTWSWARCPRVATIAGPPGPGYASSPPRPGGRWSRTTSPTRR